MFLYFILAQFLFSSIPDSGQKTVPATWKQWGMNSQHTGMVNVAGQIPETIRAVEVVDPFSSRQIRETSVLVIHYQTALVDGPDVFMENKSGEYINALNWDSLTWGEGRFEWKDGRLLKRWNFLSDWKPVHFGNGRWEPVFHAVLGGDSVYVPGFGGTVYKIDRGNGKIVKRFNPFGTAIHSDIFVVGPLSMDDSENIYYNTLQLDAQDPWGTNAINSWLVKIGNDGRITKASFDSLTPGAPRATSLCEVPFTINSPTDVAPTNPCGSQRPTLNTAPAIAKDGTIYTISRSHFNSRYGYLVAVTPQLKPKWAASFRDRLHDGCGVTIPSDGTIGCIPGLQLGVDPQTNNQPAGQISENSTSSPAIAPDGSIFYGASTTYNCGGGHLFHFNSKGGFLNSYEFGWDQTPAIYTHDGTYSVIIKENHYGGLCEQAWYITQLNKQLKPEWKYRNLNQLSCRIKDGKQVCKRDHPDGFEWCVNAAAVDKNGVVFANSEDGNVFAIAQGGKLIKKLFLKLAVGAAYTPVTIGPDGLIYTQNAGQLFVVGRKN